MASKKMALVLENGHYDSGVPYATDLCPKCENFTLRITCYGNYQNDNVCKVEDCKYCGYKTENSINGFKVTDIGRIPWRVR